MKKIKKLLASVFVVAIILSLANINAFAAMVTQDNLEVTLVTDKGKYAESEPIKATLTVKNNNDTAVSNVDLETEIPEGYKLADKTENKKTVESIAAGESVSLDVTLEKDNKKGSTPSEPSTDSKSSTNPVSGGNSGTTSGGTTTSGGAIQTGQEILIIGIVLLALLISGVIFIYAYRKKHSAKQATKGLLSIILCCGIVGSSVFGARIISNAEEKSTENKKSVKISTQVAVNNSKKDIVSTVSYDNIKRGTINVEVLPTFGGTVKSISGKYDTGDKVKLEASPDDGWTFSDWKIVGSGEIADSKSAKTEFTVGAEDVTIVARFVNSQNSAPTADELDVYLAYHALILGYAEGDYDNSVINNVILDTEYGEDEHKVDISWQSSDESIISNKGEVSRPEDADTYVTLTAILSKGSVVHNKEFSVKVIKSSLILPEDIENKSLIDIEKMNEDAEYPLEIEYNEDESQVEFISGQFCDILIDSVESALQSLCSVKSLIGLTDPFEELDWIATNDDGITLSYAFCQMYNGYEVYGSSVTVNADPETGKTLALSATVTPLDVLQNIDFSNTVSIDEVKNKYSDQFTVLDYSTVIYTMDSYENDPILAYVITTEDSTMIVSAVSGEIIDSFTNLQDWGDYSTTGSGVNELGERVSFPVQFHQWDWYFFYQDDVQRRVFLHGDKSSVITHEFNTEWGDKTANSAYTNVIKVYDWYKSHLNRNSIDNRGMDINVNVHDYKHEGGKDNAHWDGDNKEICFFDNSGGGIPTTAAGLDIIAHEMTHGVFQYVINQKRSVSFPYKDFTGSINEGYADVFGYLVDNDDWTMGENWKTLRSLSDPESYNAPSRMSSPNYAGITASAGTDEYRRQESHLVHTNSSLVYHAAYLMHQSEITGNKLEKLWYNSMSQGYNSKSNFHTVRRNLIQAAKNNHFSDAELLSVRKAFDDEEIFDEKGKITFKFVDENGNAFSIEDRLDFSVSMERNGEDAPQPIILLDGNTFGITGINNIYFGTYKTKVSVPGYLTFESNVDIKTNKTTELVIPLVKEGTGTVSGKITSATTGYPVESVLLKVYNEWNQTSGTVISSASTDGSGNYSFTLPAGYYTVEMSKEGYTTGYFNLTISGGKTINNKNASISPIMTFEKDFRVVLTWGANPSDLDSHLFGKQADGSNYHIYFRNKNAYNSSNQKVANLDVDDTSSYGPETTTFTADTSGNYEYYIDWYTGSGTWATCNGKVEVYNGDKLLYVFNVPSINTQAGSWKVFTFKNGIFNPINVIQSEDIY